MWKELGALIPINTPVALYGAGRYAFWAFLYLSLHDVEVECFLVTKRGTESVYLGRPLYGIDEYHLENLHTVIVAVDENEHVDISKKLKRNISAYFLKRCEILEMLRFIYGMGQEGIQRILENLYDDIDLSYIFDLLAEKGVTSFGELYDILRYDDYGREYATIYNTYRYVPRYQEMQIDLKDGRVCVPDMMSFMCAYQSILVDKIYSFLPKNEKDVTILDFGSNIGLSLYFFAKKYSTGKIIGFEADPHIYEICQNNIHALGVANRVFLYNLAVWSSDGKLDFYVEGADAGRVTIDGIGDGSCIKVKCVDALKILESYSHIDFLKIDIEGAETEVLQRIEPQLYKVDNIFVEYHSLVDKPQTLDCVLRVLIQSGFRLYFGNEGLKQSSPFLEVKSYLGFDGLLNIMGIKRDDY